MKTTRISRPILITGSVLACAVIAAASINYYIDGPERRAQAQYEAAMAHDRISSVDDLIDRLAYYQFGGLPPLPGTNDWDHTLSSAHPVDWKNFPESFQKDLIGYWYHDIPVYELYVYQDRATRKVIFLNADGMEIHSVPCPYEAPYSLAV